MVKKSDRVSAGPPAGFIKASKFKSSHRTLSTGSIMLDGALGGGWATKAICRLKGKPSVGKSTIAYNTAKSALKLGMIVIWIDSEQSYDEDRAKALGITDEMLENMYVTTPGKTTDSMYTINQVARDFDLWLKSGLCDNGFLLIIDSYDMLYSEARIEKADDSSALISDKVKIMTNFIPRLQNSLTAYDSCALIINQARANMDSYSAKFTPQIYSGGFALDHGAKQDVELTSMGQKLDSDKQVSAKTIKAKVIKNKYGPSWISVNYDLVDTGIDNAEELIRLSIDLGVCEKVNDKTYAFGEQKFVGLPRFTKWMREPENFEIIKALVYPLLNSDTTPVVHESPPDEIIGQEEQEYIGEENVI